MKKLKPEIRTDGMGGVWKSILLRTRGARTFPVRGESVVHGTVLAIFLPLTFVQGGEDIRRVSLPLPADMLRADVCALAPERGTKRVLVLCPGLNGDGEAMLKESAWKIFAREEGIGLAAIHFVSSKADIDSRERGYFHAAKGSGGALRAGLRRLYGREPEILMFGFSGGAYFINRYVEWRPERVLGWSAHSAGWWQASSGGSGVPGIVACGEGDRGNYVPSLIHFKQGRAMGERWLWLDLGDHGHARSPELERFVREYFSALLQSGSEEKGQWVDVYTGEWTSPEQASMRPQLTGWVPTMDVWNRWRADSEILGRTKGMTP